MGRVDGDFDGNGPTTHVLALKSLNSLLLLFLPTNVDESVPLASPRVAPAPADNTSRDDADSRFSEKSGKTGVVNVETEVSDKQNSLGLFALRILASRARGTRSTRLALTRSLLESSNFGLLYSRRSRFCDITGTSGFGFTSFLLLLGLLGFAGLSSVFGFRSVTVSFSLRKLPGYSLAASPAGSPFRLLLLFLLVLLVSLLGKFDNYWTAIERLLVESIDGFLSSL
jgi:hypothetical protein